MRGRVGEEGEGREGSGGNKEMKNSEKLNLIYKDVK